MRPKIILSEMDKFSVWYVYKNPDVEDFMFWSYRWVTFSKSLWALKSAVLRCV
jgi:hypothetical protein